MKSIENGDTFISRTMIDNLRRFAPSPTEVSDHLIKESIRRGAISTDCQQCNQLSHEFTVSLDDFRGKEIAELKSRCKVGGCVKRRSHPTHNSNISNRGSRFDALSFDEMSTIGPATVDALMGRRGNSQQVDFNKIFDRHLTDAQRQRKKFFQDRQSLKEFQQFIWPDLSNGNQEEPEEKKEFNDKPVTKADFIW